MQEVKSWIKPALLVIAIGAILISGITLLLLSKAPHKASVAVATSEADENGLAPVAQNQQRGNFRRSQQADSTTQSSTTEQASPQLANVAPPPPPDAQGGTAPSSAQAPAPGPGMPQIPGAPSPKTTTDSQGQQQQNQPPRMSRKDRIEKTSPEDRARLTQMRIEEMKYRAANGTPGGGPRRP